MWSCGRLRLRDRKRGFAQARWAARPEPSWRECNRALSRRPGGVWSSGVLPRWVLVLTRDEVFDIGLIRARTLGNPEQVAHRCYLFDLLADEPLHELLGGVVALFASCGRESVDLLGHASLLLERERDWPNHILEPHPWRHDTGDRDLAVRIEQELDHHHRVVALLQRLTVEKARQLRQRL